MHPLIEASSIDLEVESPNPQSTWIHPKKKFEMEQQRQANWCWAAVAVSVARHFDSQSVWTQCELVNEVLNEQDCCTNGGSDSCNKPWDLESPLNKVGQLDHSDSSQASGFPTVKTEIDAGRPLGVCIELPAGGPNGENLNHFVALTGYEPAQKWVHIEDPNGQSSDYDFDLFKTRYRASNGWTNLYWMKGFALKT